MKTFRMELGKDSQEKEKYMVSGNSEERILSG